MDDLGAAVERIMADPAFSKMVKELGGGDGVDLMEKLPRVMETLGPLLGGSGGESAGKKDTGGESTVPETMQASSEGTGETVRTDIYGSIPALIGRKPYNRSDAEKLFLALKPYLGQRRRELADRCVSLMQMGELLKAAGLTFAGSAGGGGSHEA